ncbi:VOC family protein [soil metagenome]
MVIGVNHVQVNVSAAELDRAREFYLQFMGFKEITRPRTFKSKGVWMHAGSFEMHIGVEDGVDRKLTRAHVAYEVSNLDVWRTKVGGAGYEMISQPLIPGYDRFQFRDPFGNNIELIVRTKTD